MILLLFMQIFLLVFFMCQKVFNLLEINTAKIFSDLDMRAYLFNQWYHSARTSSTVQPNTRCPFFFQSLKCFHHGNSIKSHARSISDVQWAYRYYSWQLCNVNIRDMTGGEFGNNNFILDMLFIP